MGRALNWHGWARCHAEGCDFRFSASGTADAINEAREADRHMRQNPGHAVHQGLHRLDYCETFGCVKPQTHGPEEVSMTAPD